MPMIPTPSLDSFINRKIDDQETIEMLQLYTEALDETVNKGSRMLDWTYAGMSLERHQFPVITYFRQILEFIDAISVLIKAGAVPPCAIMLRSLLEVTLGFEYLLKEDTKRRGELYEFYSYMQRLNYYEKHDPAHQNYATYQEQYSHGFAIKKVPRLPDLRNQLKLGREYMNDPENKDFLEEYKKVKKASGNSFDWYSLYSDQTNGGVLITNFQKLAIHLNKFDWYEILYKEYSKSTHGSSMILMNIYRSNDHINMLGLRHLHDAYDTINMTLRISELAFDLFNEINPNEEQRGEITWWREAFKKNYTFPIVDKRINIIDPE